MKKVLISEKQKRTIDEALEIENSIPHLPSHLLDDIRNGELSIFKCYSLPNGVLERLAAKRFIEVKEQFSDDITSYDIPTITSKLSKLMVSCIKKEEPFRKQLEKICINSIIEKFKIPNNGIKMSCSLEQDISQRTQFHVTPDTDENYEYEDYGSIEKEDGEVSKRLIINTLIMGGAVRIAEEIFKESLNKIFDIDEDLPHLYSQIMKINDYLIFAKKFKITDDSHKQGGYVNVTLGNGERDSEIDAHGVIFPILLIETIRGCMELWASHGLPDDMEAARTVINKADALENEPWYNRVGPVIWDRLYSFENTENLPSFIMSLTSLPTEEFNNILREITAGTKLGKSQISQIMQQAKYDDDYSSFEYDIKKKQSERDIIEDGYFTEEELNEAVYPDNFDMDFFKSLTSFSQRIKYCEKTLSRISSGSARIVYAIDDKTALKLAKNQKGVVQNEVEGQPDWYRDSIGLFAKVYDREENYLWIEMQLATRPKYNDFYRITGFTFKTICAWLNYISNRYCDEKAAAYFRSEEFQEKYDYSILQSLEDYVGNYDTPVGDLQRISSWGLVHDENGDEDIVLIDYGLNNSIYNNYYRR